MIWDNKFLEMVPCDYCGSNKSKEKFKRPDSLKVVECSDCGMCFIKPRPKESIIKKLYESDYFSSEAGSNKTTSYDSYYSEDNMAGLLTINNYRLETIKQVMALEGKRCLEIGCATGEFCDLLKRNGVLPIGIDISKKPIDIARKRFQHLQFFNTDIYNIPIKVKFDILFVFEVIEHVNFPRKFINRIVELLNNDGFIVLSTPNYEMCRKHGMDKWVGFQTSFSHLYFFSIKSISKYFNLNIIGSYTGIATGYYMPQNQESYIKKTIKLILKELKLLNILIIFKRNIMRMLTAKSQSYNILKYRNDTSLHNLLVILQKQ